MSRQIVRHSEAFKLQVVSELESGALGSMQAARQRYGIRGGGTGQGWLKKYGGDHLRSRNRVEDWQPTLKWTNIVDSQFA